MTPADIDAALPNGFHDAALRELHVDYTRQDVVGVTRDAGLDSRKLKVTAESFVTSPRTRGSRDTGQGFRGSRKDEGLPGCPGSPRHLIGNWSGKPDSNRRPSAWEAASLSVQALAAVRKMLEILS